MEEKEADRFFGGRRNRILVSIIFSPDGPRKTAALIVGLVMLCVGWFFRAKYERYILQGGKIIG